jgi:hypothetical protein
VIVYIIILLLSIKRFHTEILRNSPCAGFQSLRDTPSYMAKNGLGPRFRSGPLDVVRIVYKKKEVRTQLHPNHPLCVGIADGSWQGLDQNSGNLPSSVCALDLPRGSR